MRAQPKKGVLGAGTAPKKGGLKHIYNPNKRVLGTEVAQKGVLGAYLFIIFTLICQYDQNGGLRCGSNSKKGGLRCGSGQTKGGGVFAATYTYTEHICESPPPPPSPGQVTSPY